MDVPEYATKQACAGNQYPAEFCATDIKIALLEGCAGNQIPAEFCATDIKITRLKDVQVISFMQSFVLQISRLLC